MRNEPPDKGFRVLRDANDILRSGGVDVNADIDGNRLADRKADLPRKARGQILVLVSGQSQIPGIAPGKTSGTGQLRRRQRHSAQMWAITSRQKHDKAVPVGGERAKEQTKTTFSNREFGHSAASAVHPTEFHTSFPGRSVDMSGFLLWVTASTSTTHLSSRLA